MIQIAAFYCITKPSPQRLKYEATQFITLGDIACLTFGDIVRAVVLRKNNGNNIFDSPDAADFL